MARGRPKPLRFAPFFAAAGAVALVVIAWSASRQSTTQHLDTDGLGQLLGAPDPTESALEDNLVWALGVVNGEPISQEGYEQRLSPWFRSQLSLAAFQSQTTRILATGPYRLYGFEVEAADNTNSDITNSDATSQDAGADPRRVAQAALLGADGQAYVFVVTEAFDNPDQLDGLLITPVDAPRGAFTGWEFLVHAGASLFLLAGAWLLHRFDRSGRNLPTDRPGNRRPRLVPAPVVMAGAGALWPVQLLELSDASVPFTAALAAGPLAATITGLAVVASVADRVDDTSFATAARTTGTAPRALVGAAAVVVLAGVAALAPLVAIDTAGIGRPENLLALAPGRHLAQNLVAISSVLVVVAAVGVAIWAAIQQFTRTGADGRAQVPATIGIVAAAGLAGAAAWGSVADTDGYDLSQTPLLSMAAIAATLGLVGTGFWNRYDEGQRAEELAQQNEELQQELAVQLAEVEASRARIVQAAEDARRGIERDLHDGAQQRLVALLLAIQLGRERFGSLDTELDEFLVSIADDLGVAVGELRELARGLRPAVLERGIAAAAEALAEVSPVPVTVVADDVPRCSPTVEQTAYYVISESLTNAARHADASHIEVTISNSAGPDGAASTNGHLHCVIVDDGRGGASVAGGHGLQNIQDRVQAIGGQLTLTSPPGGPTTITAVMGDDL